MSVVWQECTDGTGRAGGRYRSGGDTASGTCFRKARPGYAGYVDTGGCLDHSGLSAGGATVRIGAYFTGNVGDKVSYAEFSTVQPSFEATYVIGEDGALSPCLTDAAGNRMPGNAQGLIVRGGVYDFYAVSPARGLVKDTDGFNRITDIPHQEDIMTSYARGVTVSKTSHLVTLETFTRRCAQLVFTVAPSPNNKVPMDELRATSLVLTELSRSALRWLPG